MDPKILWVVLLTIFSLVQIVLLLVKNRKVDNPGKYGERIATLEKGQEGIEERLNRIEKKLNGVK